MTNVRKANQSANVWNSNRSQKRHFHLNKCRWKLWHLCSCARSIQYIWHSALWNPYAKHASWYIVVSNQLWALALIFRINSRGKCNIIDFFSVHQDDIWSTLARNKANQSPLTVAPSTANICECARYDICRAQSLRTMLLWEYDTIVNICSFQYVVFITMPTTGFFTNWTRMSLYLRILERNCCEIRTQLIFQNCSSSELRFRVDARQKIYLS